MKNTIDTLSRAFAFLGGLMLLFLIALTCVSVAGRSLGFGLIQGDFEIIEAGIAFAIFAFLPLCQFHSAHASVDIFMSAMPRQFAALLRAVVEVVFAAVLILIAWQLFEGALSKYRTGQTTLLLEFPVWWSYAACVVAMSVAVVVGIYVAMLRCLECARNTTLLPENEG